MPGLLLSVFIRSLALRGSRFFAGFSLIFALVAGLACDESAPTETRAAPPSERGTGSEDPDFAVDDITAMAIALPVNQSVATTAPAPAFRVNQTGTGPNGIFQITRSGSTQTALQGLTNGRGRAGFFQINNTANANSALEVTTNGTARAASFQVTNASNNSGVLQASTNGGGPALRGLATGTLGGGGLFDIMNTSNNQTALTTRTNGGGLAFFAATQGTGSAGHFTIQNAGNNQHALQVSSNAVSEASALYVERSSALGYGGAFDITNASNPRPAVLGRTAASSGRGGWFVAIAPSNTSTALFTENTSTGGLALHAVGNSSFEGNVHVAGTLSKNGGSFRIDHPLDPERKYLSHSFVESPDMMNVYNGNATLDENGRATVELPEYFEALNKDFRYQLTAVGAPGPNLYIAEGVKQNRFRIAGGRPYASVSWQVTGVRQDTYANEHRIKVEEDKPAKEQKEGDRLVARR